jgi:hypothetical protein
VKDFESKFSSKIDILGIKFEKQLASFANDQQEQFTDFHCYGIFGVSLPPHIISVSNAIKIIYITGLILGVMGRVGSLEKRIEKLDRKVNG